MRSVETRPASRRLCGTIAIVDAPVRLIPGFLAPDRADETLARLLVELPWARRTSKMYGKDAPVPRMEVWIADHPYTYSGRTYQATSWTQTLLRVKVEVEAAAGSTFNSVLANRYENERDSVGWHADNEPEMSNEHPIASLSLGAKRNFQLRRGSGPVQTIELGHGSLLVMGAGMQKEWKHQVPKSKSPCGLRVNLTFRWMIFSTAAPTLSRA
jgi:alkylated DNA repair dioxygenase AlkB